MAKVLNIEICDQTVSVCRTARKGKSVRVTDSFVFATPEGSVSDGVISNPSLLANELQLQLASHGVRGTKNVVFALSSSRIAAREVKLPPMKKKLIATAIRTNSADYFPIDLKSYHITYYILDLATSAKPYNRILVMAVPVSMIDGYFQLAERAGLTVKDIDSSGNSQYQALKQISLKGVSVFIDVGGSSSVISFMREGKLLLQRNFAFGADELISHYMSLSSKTREQYVEILSEIDITDPAFDADKLMSLLDVQSDLERLAGGIMRSIDYFNSSQWDAPVSRIVLIGLHRHTIGLREYIGETTGLETLYLDEIQDFAQFTNNASDAAAYVGCIGSSLEPLDLIPKQFRPSRRITVDDDDSSIVPGVIMCGIIVVGAILISVSSWLGYATTLQDLVGMQNDIQALRPAQDTYNRHIAFQDSEKSVGALASMTDTPNAKLLGFFEELEKKMPSSILLMSAACNNDGVSLNITVGSYTDAASVISTLRGFESVASVDISGLTRTENEAGLERVAFTANCAYGVNPYTSKLNPYREFMLPAENATAGAQPSPSSSDTQAAPSPVAPVQ